MTRRRYRFDTELGQMVEVGSDWTDAERRSQVPTEGIVYGSLPLTTDGTDVSTKRRHREYMQRNGLTIGTDYKTEWASKMKQREEIKTTGGDHRARKEAIGRVAYEMQQRGRKR